jgi:hypothetical protein
VSGEKRLLGLSATLARKDSVRMEVDTPVAKHRVLIIYTIGCEFDIEYPTEYMATTRLLGLAL